MPVMAAEMADFWRRQREPGHNFVVNQRRVALSNQHGRTPLVSAHIHLILGSQQAIPAPVRPIRQPRLVALTQTVCGILALLLHDPLATQTNQAGTEM